MSEVLDFLKANRVFFLATAAGDQAKARPLGFVMEHEGRLYFGVGNHKEVYKQMKSNPKVEIVSVNPEGQWLRLTGSAVFDERPAVFEAALAAMPRLKDMYGDPQGPKLAAFYLAPAEAVLYGPAGPVKTIKL